MDAARPGVTESIPFATRNHFNALAAFGPQLPSMVPGEKPARSRRICSLNVAAPRLGMRAGNFVRVAPADVAVIRLYAVSVESGGRLSIWLPKPVVSSEAESSVGTDICESATIAIAGAGAGVETAALSAGFPAESELSVTMQPDTIKDSRVARVCTFAMPGDHSNSGPET